MPRLDSVEDYSKLLTRQQLNLERDRLTRAARIADAVAVVEGLDGYETWVATLEEKREAARKLAEQAAIRSASGFPPAGSPTSVVDYVLASRHAYAEAMGAYHAFDTALTLIPSLVKSGKDARDSLRDLA